MLKVGDYYRIDRHEIVSSPVNEEPIYDVICGDVRIRINQSFSSLVPGAKGVELRPDTRVTLFSSEDYPYFWLPVKYVRPDSRYEKSNTSEGEQQRSESARGSIIQSTESVRKEGSVWSKYF